MSKGGGGGSEEQTVYQSSLPEYAQPYFERLMARTEASSLQPYTTYPGQRLNDFSGDQLSAFQGTRDLYNAGPDPRLGFATSAAGNVLNLQNPYNATSFNGGVFDNAAAQQYMNPYIQNVLGVQNDMLQSRFAEQQGIRNAQAVKSGAFGGSRGAIANQVAQRGLNEQMNLMNAQGMAQAYDTGATLFDRDRVARLGAERMTDESNQFLANSGLQYGQLGLQGSQAMAGLAELAQKLQTDKLGLLSQAGAAQQQLGQKSMDIGYQDFLRQEGWERQMLDYYSRLLHGVPVGQSGTTTTSGGSSSTAGILGGGIAGLGLLNSMGAFS